MLAIFCKIAKCSVVNCAHICTHTHTLAKLCLHTCIRPQPAAGKTSANYSLRAAFAAQCSMLFDTVCLEFVKFQVSHIEFFFFIILCVLPAFHKHITMIVPDNLHVVEINMCSAFSKHIFNFTLKTLHLGTVIYVDVIEYTEKKCF